MKKLLVIIFSLIALVGFQSCSDGGNRSRVQGGGDSSLMNSQEQEDLMEYRRSQANYGKIFRSLMETVEDACAIFDDYVISDDVYMTMSYSGIREYFANEKEDYTY